MVIKTAIIKLYDKEYRVSGNENMTKKQAYNKFVNKYMKHSQLLPGFGDVDIALTTREV